MSNINFRVGLRIRSRRESLNLSQARLASESGLSVSFISDVENGKRGIRVENLVKVARVMGRKLDWFVRDNSDRYGRCPHCNGRCVERERRINGNDKCENGHVYPSKAAVNPGGS